MELGGIRYREEEDFFFFFYKKNLHARVLLLKIKNSMVNRWRHDKRLIVPDIEIDVHFNSRRDIVLITNNRE